MTFEDQNKFYALLGRALTLARQRRNMSIAQLSTKSGEQHKTIRGIEEGKPTSMHHVLWLSHVLGVDINKVITEFQGGNNGKAESSQGQITLTAIDASGISRGHSGQAHGPSISSGGDQIKVSLKDFI